MLVSAHVSPALVASFRRADVPTSCRPAAARTLRTPSAPARWLGRFHHVMLGVLVMMALGSAGLPHTTFAAVRPTGNTTSTAALAPGRYRTYVPMVRTAPQSTASTSIDLSKYPTEYAANNGYVYTGRRAQVLHHIQAYYSERTTTYATHSECATCSADLWTVGARGGVDNTAMSSMNAMAEYLRTNAAALGLRYVIWNQQISIGGRAWQEMEDRGSITANHKDHVHITFADSFK